MLTPRPETETLVERALAILPDDQPVHISIWASGSGAILLAILAERPLAEGFGNRDFRRRARCGARQRQGHLGLATRARFAMSNWAGGLASDAFDLVVSNPPYIPSGDIAGLDPEVRDFEPHLALDGGQDGLDAYRALAPEMLRVLKPGGRFLLEVGLGQAAAVSELLQQAGAKAIETYRDLSGCERVVAGGKSF